MTTNAIFTALEALAAVRYCLSVIKTERISAKENAIWSTGTSDRPRITEEVLMVCEKALSVIDRPQPPQQDVSELQQSQDYWRDAAHRLAAEKTLPHIEGLKEAFEWLEMNPKAVSVCFKRAHHTGKVFKAAKEYLKHMSGSTVDQERYINEITKGAE